MKQGVFKVYPVSSPQAPSSKFPLSLAYYPVLQPAFWLSLLVIAMLYLRLPIGEVAFQHQSKIILHNNIEHYQVWQGKGARVVRPCKHQQQVDFQTEC